MSDLAFDDPCVLFALRRESAPFLREFRPNQRMTGAPCWARFCGPAWLTLLVAETGGMTETSLAWLLGAPVLEKVPYRPKLVLAAGFAAALRDDLRTGDIVLATEVVDAVGTAWPTTWPGALPAGDWRPPIRRDRVLSVAPPPTEANARRELGQRHNAAVLDASAGTVARLCSERNVPFGCVRVVLDALTDVYSARLGHLLAGRTLSPIRVVGAALRSPVGLSRLARQTNQAAQQLALALGELLTLTLPGGRDL